MTVDSNHLRGLCRGAWRGPYVQQVCIAEGGEDATTIKAKGEGNLDFAEFIEGDPDEERQAAYLEALDPGTVEELLDRSDAFTEALRLLRYLPPDTCGECLDGVRGSGEDCCVREDLEQHRWGRERADLLARYPEEAS